MGNCECIKNSSVAKEFFLEEHINKNNIINEVKSHINNKLDDNNTTQKNNQDKKNQYRGVNNPTQNNIIKNLKSENDKSIGDNENKLKAEKNKETKEIFEESIEVSNVGDSSVYNSEKDFNNKINSEIDKSRFNNEEKTNIVEDQCKKKPTLNKKLTDILKLKNISKNDKEDKNIINIVLLGEKCTGKTSLVYQFISNKFDQFYIQTINKEEFNKSVNYNDKQFILNLIVTSGDPQYQQDYSSIFKSADFFIVCYDVTSIQSFEKSKDIINNEICRYLYLLHDNFANVILLGNKADIKEKNVPISLVGEFCNKYSINFFEVSAKTKMNIENTFMKLIQVYDEILAKPKSSTG